MLRLALITKLTTSSHRLLSPIFKPKRDPPTSQQIPNQLFERSQSAEHLLRGLRWVAASPPIKSYRIRIPTLPTLRLPLEATLRSRRVTRTQLMRSLVVLLQHQLRPLELRSVLIRSTQPSAPALSTRKSPSAVTSTFQHIINLK